VRAQAKACGYLFLVPKLLLGNPLLCKALALRNIKIQAFPLIRHAVQAGAWA
jgi:hypothetical protein